MQQRLVSIEPMERRVLEMWLDANERGVAMLPSGSHWRELAIQLQVALREDLGLPALPATPSRPERLDPLRLVR
jgi:hypothetical protein